MTQFHETRIVTRSFLIDLLQHWRNLFGWRLRGYEEMINDTADEILDEIHAQYEVEWYRVDVDQMGGGSMSISVYGEGDRK